jgi:uncharacterized membrane protein
VDSDEILFWLTALGGLGAALVAGVLFAFSSFVMPGLKRLPPHEGIAAMQAINITAVTPAFMAAFGGTAAISLLLGGWGVFRLGEEDAPWLLAGGLAYLFGTFILTAAYHVPRNNRLAELEAAAPASAEHWRVYLREWVPPLTPRQTARRVSRWEPPPSCSTV